MMVARHRFPVWRERSDLIINAALEENGHHEQLWCRRISDSTAEVCCVPFFLYDVSLGDTVAFTQDADGGFVLKRVVEESGRYVFRVYFEPPMLAFRDDVEASIRDLGGLVEWSSEELVAVDVPTEDDAEHMATYLQEREDAGHLIYETGRAA